MKQDLKNPSRQNRDTVLAALDRAVKAWGPLTWIQLGEDAYSFDYVDRESAELAYGLATLGVKPGDTVVTFLDTSIDPILCWLAINKLGGIWVPVNTAYSGEFLRHQVADSKAAIVIAESHYVERLEAITASLPDLRTVVSRGEAVASDKLELISLEACRHNGVLRPLVQPDPADICCIVYTSGTTGPSKGCMLSHNYMCNLAGKTNDAVPLAPGEGVWSCLPLFHVGGSGYFLLAAMLAGNRACVAPRFSVTGFWDDIERTGAVHALIIASMFPLLAQAPETLAMKRCFGQLRAVTGIPCSERLRKIWNERFGVQQINSFIYGQTEASPITRQRRGAPLPPEGSLGTVADEYELKIFSDNDTPVAVGELGEIVIRPRFPDVMFSGYWRRPEETVKVWRNLWMHTGDIGKLDEAGNLYFVDRKKDYLRSRGENISSFEVENVIGAHPDISEVAVHSVPGEPGEEEHIKFTIVLMEGAALTEEGLWTWSAERLPHFATPRFIEFRPSLPKTPTGKVQKFQLRNDKPVGSVWDAIAAGYSLRKSSAQKKQVVRSNSLIAEVP